MTSPRPGAPRTAASPPPAGLPGLDPRFSRIVGATDPGSGDRVSWHVLDTGRVLEQANISPVGTILAVHGNPTWSYLWRSVAALATERAVAGGRAWRVVAPDQLEMGFSERTGVRRGLPDRVRELGALTDELGITGPVVTLGHDWGGVVSMGWAVDHPDRLAAVTLLNTAIHQDPARNIPAPLRLALLPGVLELSTQLTPAFLETTLSIAHPRLETQVADAYRAPYRSPARRVGIRDFVADIPVDPGHASFAELDRIAETLRSVDVPALMMWGPRDPIFGDRYLDDLADRLPQADVHRFEGAGHLLAEDVDIATPLLDWLDGLEPRTDPEAAAAGRAPALGSASIAAHVAGGGARRPLWHHLPGLAEQTRTDVRPTADPSEIAVVEMVPRGGAGPRSLTWERLGSRVRDLAAGLAARGMRRGDRVSLLVPPGADLTAALYACVRLGAIVVVADAGLGVKGLTRAVRGAQPDWIIGALPGLAASRALGWPGVRLSTVTLPAATRVALGVEASLSQVAESGRGSHLPAEPTPDDIAAILFTSGSTGPAKGVVYTHARLEAMRDLLGSRYGVGPGVGLVAGFAPFALLGPALGARTATPDMDVTAPRTLTAEAVADAVSAVDAEVLFLSPAAIANVVATATDLPEWGREALGGVRLMLSAGAPVPVELLDRAAELVPAASLHTPYGMTEGLLLTDITLDEIHDATAHRDVSSDGALTGGGVCVGRPADGVVVRIAPLSSDGSVETLPVEVTDVTGEIVVSAPHIKAHYDRLHLTDARATLGTQSLGGPTSWHRTGDVGHIDAQGRLWVEGRLPHVIVTANGPVTPVAPELRIGALPTVDRAAVVGVGPVGTQVLVAVVETVSTAQRVGLADAELAGAVRDAARLPLAAVLVVPVLPTDIRHNSKIERLRLAEWAEGVLAGGRMTAP